MKKIILFIIVGMLLCQLGGCETVKHYPLTEDSFADMTDEQLVEAIVVHPKLKSVSLMSSYVSDWFAEECGAYKELIARENGIDALSVRVEELREEGTIEAEFLVSSLNRLIGEELLKQQESE